MALVLALTGVLAGCDDVSNQSQAQTRPLVKVAVVDVKSETLPVVSSLPGRIAPMMTAEVRPQVTGVIRKRVFEQGSDVRQGDVMYVIDPAPFESKVRSARATLDSSKAAQSLAAQKASRQQELQRNNVTSQQDTESAVSALAQANADVERAEADLQIAQLELQYTKVTAPISGRTGRAMITEGALVSPTSDPLVVISQIDPVYADFTQPVDSMIRIKNAVANGGLKSDAGNNALLKLMFDAGREYPHGGRLLFSEVSVNSATGQVILRGEFPNPDHNLLPGMYVRGQLEQAALENALAVPKQAVQHDTSGNAKVLIVDDQRKVIQRQVEIGWAIGGRWVIVNGLKDGDKVIVEGQQKTAPGATVDAEPWSSGSASTAPAAQEG